MNIFVFFHKLDSCFLAESASKDETITKEGRGQANSGQEVVTDTEQLLNAADEYRVHSIDVAWNISTFPLTTEHLTFACPLLVQYTLSANSKHQLDVIQWKAFSGLSYYMVTATTMLAGDKYYMYMKVLLG